MRVSGLNDAAYERIVASAQQYVADEILSTHRPDGIGDSEIEKLFTTALVARVRFTMAPFDLGVRFPRTEDQLAANLDHHTRAIIVLPQAHMPWGRVDFLVHAYCHYERFAPLGWRRLVVECDGHDFHERTKEQAARDRSRDREGQLAGFTVFRFTGSELWRDAWGCAGKVIDWAEQGV
jgi:hypothetical protein